MRILVIECTSEACSVALFDNSKLLAGEHAVLGRGHAERLIPMIAELPERGHADRILVSLGPGSFTGVRIGIATARALCIAWNCDVLGYPTLALVAACAQQSLRQAVTVCMNGGHGEWFVQNFSAELEAEDDPRSLSPEDAVAAARQGIIAGNRAEDLAAHMDGQVTAHVLFPDARAAHALPPALLTDNLAPVYGRAPDAKPATPQPAPR